ncbi:serine/threonine-protein kinase [Aspergillus lucknowensis]|uniref:Protein kinase domain-containing protein n=1 Tax=Aspergillus lucknowensis TaxID=176173 RepID=A0ABR4LW11_9EURO
MGSAAHNFDGEPSPFSSPLGLLSESPETESYMTPFSGNAEASLRCSVENLPAGFDPLPRSPLLEHEHGLGPSGLDRIRSQPPSRVFTLPNLSTSSIGAFSPRTVSPSPRSLSSSRANSMAVASGQDANALEDLHRFPSESLHSFSFAQQSEELLHTRQNILKRSIDFMRDRFGWASSSTGLVSPQHRMHGGTDTQAMVDLLSQSSISGKGENLYHPAGPVRGRLTGPADVGSDNVFEKSFTEAQPSVPEFKEVLQEPTQPRLTSSQQLPPERRGLISAPASRRVSLKRTFTDVTSSKPHGQLMDILAQPYATAGPFSPLSTSTLGSLGPVFPTPVLHTHSSKWNPVSQAVFRTESKAPWTILAANDLSCLVFGVTQAEVRKLSILEVVQDDRRQWLESKLRDPTTDGAAKIRSSPDKPRMKPTTPRPMGMGNGVTAQLLSKPPSRARPSRRAQTDDGYGSSAYASRQVNHPATKSRGVLLCGDVVPIQKRNGAKGSASIWVMEKRGGLIWVLEEIQEDVAYINCDESWNILDAHGATDKVWGQGAVETGKHLTELLPHIPPGCLGASVEKGVSEITEIKYFAARTSGGIGIPITVSKGDTSRCLRVSSLPHVAGIMVLSSSSLKIISSNSVFSSTLFGYERPEGLDIADLIPGFDDYLYVISDEENVPLVDGVVIPELSFRRARTLSILREGKANVASVFLEPAGITAKHRDGSTIAVDVQLRVVKSGSIFPKQHEKQPAGGSQNEVDDGPEEAVTVTELVYALWVTYSRNIHSFGPPGTFPSPHNASPLQAESPSATPIPRTSSAGGTTPRPTRPERTAVETRIPTSTLSQQLSEAASEPLTDRPIQLMPEVKPANTKEVPKKRTIADYVILEEMGQGAYGEVKLARLKKSPAKKVVLKYVTKKRILVDTWTRDRRLGTVPLEIHVLDFLRKDGLKHPNIVEMEGFFEDDINYYIEMLPHGLPGMDLFDYIELKTNMDEEECRNIFKQVVSAIHHLHTKALVVHRDIKDENVILDGEGRIKLIDFGSAAYIKNGPFDVFVGTIDYAAPEVLQGKSYRGKEQDIWALGILLYTIVYKENPFYNIDEILDHPLRVPFLPFSEDCIDLIRRMLDRDVDNRLTISEVLKHPWIAVS